MPVAVFRCDATAKLGGGHAMRCLTLADALTEQGWDCVFACCVETLAIVPRIAGYRRILLGASDEYDVIRSEIGECSLIIVDHYGRDASFEGACRDLADAILVIDDLADRRHDCDVLLDQTPGRIAAEYQELVGSDVRMLLGPQFALLRPQFDAARDDALQRRKSSGEARRVLVSLGASDPHSLTIPVTRALHERGGNLFFDCVVGANTDLTSLDRLDRVAWHRDVADMAALMTQADLAVGAPGTTSWERCALGLPSIVVVTAENQRLIAAELVRCGAAQAAGYWDCINLRALALAVERLSKDPDRLKAMSQAASELCDGRGTARVVDILKGIVPGSFAKPDRSA